MAACKKLCDICETRDVTVFATDWCPECEQSLCESCTAHHSAAKLSKNHQTIPVESFDKLPAAVKEITNDCCEHGARFEYYCSQHELGCCVECLKTTHSECRHLSSMHTVVEHYKTSNALSDFDQTLSDLLNNLHTLTKDRLTNISLLSDQKDECLKGIKEAKQNIIAHLDELEMKLKVKIETLHRKQVKAIEGTIKEFEVLKTNVEKMQEEADVIKEYASDFQLFIAFRVFEGSVKNLEKDMQSFITKDSAKPISFSFSPNVELAIETLLPSLGNVNVITKELDIKLVNHRGKQAQLLAIEPPCIDKMKLKPKFENAQLPSGGSKTLVIRGNCFLSNGRLAFSDQMNKRLIVFKDTGFYAKDIPLSFSPNAVAFIPDNEIAISDCSGMNINIISIASSTVDHSFDVEGSCIDTFSFTKGQFLITVMNFGFYITDIKGNILNKIPYSASDFMNAVLLNDKIYYSQYAKDRVVCCDLNGVDIHEFKDKKLKSPLGVECCDKNILFITGFQSNNIYALSSTGSEFQELYCKSDLSGARAISYNCSMQQLLVSTQEGKIFLFDVSF